MPYLIRILSSILFSVLGAYSFPFGQGPGLLLRIAQWAPQVLDLLFYIGLIYTVRHRLRNMPVTGEPMRFELRESISSFACDVLAGFRKARHWTPS